MKFGITSLDLSYELPSSGIVEILAYPGTGLTTILKTVAKYNEAIFITPEYHNDVRLAQTFYLDTLIEIIVGTEEHMYVVDSVPDFVSIDELRRFEEHGASYDRKLLANEWFSFVRLIKPILERRKSVIVLGNIRKTQIPRSARRGYVSPYPREQAQTFDRAAYMIIKTEPVKTKTMNTGKSIILQTWSSRKQESGMQVLIHGGNVRHDYEKLMALKYFGLASELGDSIAIGPRLVKKRDLLKLLGNEYDERFVDVLKQGGDDARRYLYDKLSQI